MVMSPNQNERKSNNIKTVQQILEDWMLWLSEYTISMFFLAAEYGNNSKILWLALALSLLYA